MLPSTLYPLARPLLFSLPPEKAHHLTLHSLDFATRLRLLPTQPPQSPQPHSVAGLSFPSPVGLAAGLDKSGAHLSALARLGFGFLEMGTLTPRPQPGNPAPRLFRLPAARSLINRMGFNNPGLEVGLQNARRAQLGSVPLGINIGKNKDTPPEKALDDYLLGLEGAYPLADYLAANLSSPNTPGLRDLQAVESAARLLDALQSRRAELAEEHGRHVPLAIKVAPDLEATHLRELAALFVEKKLDLLIATNTTITRPLPPNLPHRDEAGGLSGAAMRALSTEVIAAFHAEMKGQVPIIGVGGIFSAQDALDKKRAGASLIQIYSGLVYRGPALIAEIIEAWDNDKS